MAVPVPAALRESMRDVLDQLRAADSDADISVDFDDALQTDVLVGGRVHDGPRSFAFTYFHREGDREERWYLRLAEIELRDIARGHTQVLTLDACSTCGDRASERLQSCRCALARAVEPQRAQRPHTFPEVVEVLAGLGVEGVDEETTIEDLRARLGEPAFEAPRTETTPAILRYRLHGEELTLEFWKSGRLRRASVVPVDATPSQVRAEGA